MEKVKYSNFGWLPAKEMKPYNNHTVVMIVEQNGYFPLIERLGYYENGEWVIYDVDNDYKILCIIGIQYRLWTNCCQRFLAL